MDNPLNKWYSLWEVLMLIGSGGGADTFLSVRNGVLPTIRVGVGVRVRFKIFALRMYVQDLVIYVFCSCQRHFQLACLF